jgi:hypothetical protein
MLTIYQVIYMFGHSIALLKSLTYVINKNAVMNESGIIRKADYI